MQPADTEQDSYSEPTTDPRVPWTELTAFQQECLFAVSRVQNERRNHGLAIKEHLEEERYEGEIRHGRLYPNLDRLVDLRLVEKGQIDDRTNSYELTEDGERLLKAHVSWVLRSPLAQTPITDGGQR